MLILGLRLLITILVTIGGTAGSYNILRPWLGLIPLQVFWPLIGLIAIVSALLAFSLTPRVIGGVIQATHWAENKLQKASLQELVGSAVGLTVGLIIANLFGISLYRLPLVGPYLFILVSLLLAYLGWSVGGKKREELHTAWRRIGGRERAEVAAERKASASSAKILDTSVIIDGRIADICNTGFLQGTLVIPSFVLEELRHIADSSDLLRRNRGRCGLDILNRMRKDSNLDVEIMEKDFDDLNEVDSKLVRLAQTMGGAQILTNDYNLNKVAELQGVKVLNINQLANALKPVVLPGEEMLVQVIKEGKEAGQGIGYLDDGTMIVVENGRRFRGQTITVLVTSVLQTAAGRMIFARPKGMEKKQGSSDTTLERGDYQWLT